MLHINNERALFCGNNLVLMLNIKESMRRCKIFSPLFVPQYKFGGMEINMSEKRMDYITWDEYFMGVAKLSALRSKDPNTQVGACIVSEDNKILSMGYNGFPTDPYNAKYLYSTHGELNAILNYRGPSLEGSKLYVTLFPCNECAKAIIQSGIKTIIYEDDKYKESAVVRASKRMLNAAKVRYYEYQPGNRVLKINV